MNQPMWQPSAERVAQANLTAFMQAVRERYGVDVHDSPALYEWSIRESEAFWRACWSFCGVIAQTQGSRILIDKDRMPGAQWFPDARLNFAENLLRRRDESIALVFWGEDRFRATVTY